LHGGESARRAHNWFIDKEVHAPGKGFGKHGHRDIEIISYF